MHMHLQQQAPSAHLSGVESARVKNSRLTTHDQHAFPDFLAQVKCPYPQIPRCLCPWHHPLTNRIGPR